MPQTGNLSLVTTQQENPQYGQLEAESNPTVSLCTAVSSSLHKKNKLVNQKWSLERKLLKKGVLGFDLRKYNIYYCYNVMNWLVYMYVTS